MTSHLYAADYRDRAIAERLSLEFEAVLPPSAVHTTLAGAERDLAGQIAPEAWDEMVYRLAQYRLGQITADDTHL
jgi:hypothetical protein